MPSLLPSRNGQIRMSGGSLLLLEQTRRAETAGESSQPQTTRPAHTAFIPRNPSPGPGVFRKKPVKKEVNRQYFYRLTFCYTVVFRNILWKFSIRILVRWKRQA